MEVKMKKTAKGANFDYPAGKTVDLPEQLAKAFISGGIATAVETATVAPVETATAMPAETPEAAKPEPEKATAKKTTKKGK